MTDEMQFGSDKKIRISNLPHVSPRSIEIARDCDVHSCHAAKRFRLLKFPGGDLWPFQTAEVF
jgi:hypothetical protein